MTTTTRFAFTLSLATLIAACSAGRSSSSTSIGAAGGTVTTQSGITLRVPAGAISQQTEVRIVESQPKDGAMAHVELEPHGLALAVPASLSFKVDDGNVNLAEVEHGPQGDSQTALSKKRHPGEVEVQVEHLGEIEMEHATACAAACDTGFECDDGVCKPHDEVESPDDNGVDPAAPGAPADDHGVDPAPAPAPAPAPGDDPTPHT